MIPPLRRSVSTANIFSGMLLYLHLVHCCSPVTSLASQLKMSPCMTTRYSAISTHSCSRNPLSGQLPASRIWIVHGIFGSIINQWTEWCLITTGKALTVSKGNQSVRVDSSQVIIQVYVRTHWSSTKHIDAQNGSRFISPIILHNHMLISSNTIVNYGFLQDQ
jgi:hypothetical protein